MRRPVIERRRGGAVKQTRETLAHPGRESPRTRSAHQREDCAALTTEVVEGATIRFERSFNAEELRAFSRSTLAARK